MASLEGALNPKRLKEFKIVLMGESGKGKTCFLQLLLNYAEQDKKKFDLQKVKPIATQITTRPSWESDTTESKSYKAIFQTFQLTIIDTPGFSDTRGSEQDQLNIKNILECVRQEDFLNCVCIIVNGRESRLTEATKNFLAELTTILPPVVLEKLFVVCTNCEGKCDLSFKYEMLWEYHLEVQVEQRFYLDNPYARYLNTKALPPSEAEEDGYSDEYWISAFQQTRNRLEKMFSTVKTMGRMETSDFGFFRNTCEEVRLSFAKLAVHQSNRDKLANELQKVLLEGGSILGMRFTLTELNETAEKNVYCTTCMKNCHPGCDCWLAFVLIRFCSKFTWGKCRQCGHDSSRHNRTKHLYSTGTMDVVIKTSDNQDSIRECEEKIRSYDARISSETVVLKNTLKKFQCIGSHFALSDQTKRQIEVFKEDNSSIEGYKHQDEIGEILSSTLQVIRNPYNFKSGDTKYLWACGMLGANPDILSSSDIATLYRQQSRVVHPDATQDPTTSEKFKQLNHAKDYLENHFSL